MKKKILIVTIGTLLLFVGLYFFPFGTDFVLYNLTAIIGGYWSAILVLYIICSTLIIFGLIFIKWGKVILTHLSYIIVLIAAIVVVTYAVVEMTRHIKGG